MPSGSFFSFSYKALRKIFRKLSHICEEVLSLMIVYGNNIKLGKNVRFNGIPFVDIHKKGSCSINDNCSFNSRTFYNPIGRNQKCQIVVGEDAVLCIGKNVGMSSSAIVCYMSVTIGDNVKIGGNTVIYDSDFHSLDFKERRTGKNDIPKMSPVIIGDDVFIGSHVTILKGVHIGARATIAACSVITKNIPPDEIWGGNPGKKIR